MKKMRQMALKLLVLCLVLTGMAVTTVSAAAKKPQLVKQTVLITANGYQTVQMQNAAGKVQWKSLNTNLIRITKTTGKYSQNAQLKAADRTGTCTVTATVSGKTYPCKVILTKRGSVSAYTGKSDKITLEKLYVTPEDIKVLVRRRNGSKKELSYGVNYRVEKLVNGKWKKMTPHPNAAVPDIAVILPAKTSQTQEYTITDFYKRSDFTKGKYRLYVEAAYRGKPMSYVNFNIK